jgi:hypothetical protein
VRYNVSVERAHHAASTAPIAMGLDGKSTAETVAEFIMLSTEAVCRAVLLEATSDPRGA